MISPTYFITAIGTDIGKSYVMESLIRLFKEEEGAHITGLKPIISGFDEEDEGSMMQSDTMRIIKALDLDESAEVIHQVSPWRFKEPLSPDMAARAEGAKISFEKLVDYCRHMQCQNYDPLLIEGVGGVMVPLNDHSMVIDWIEALTCEVILVSGHYLGALSHTLTAYQCLKQRGIKVHSIIISEGNEQEVDMDETIVSLRHFIKEIPIIRLKRGGRLSLRDFRP